MFIGFKKVKSKDSDTVHLSTDGLNTVCGSQVKKDWEQQKEISEDDAVCKRCRRSVIIKGRKE